MKHDRIAPCPKTECTQTFTLVSFVLLFLLSSISPKIRKINTICAAHCKREGSFFDLVFGWFLDDKRFIRYGCPNKWKF